MRKILFSAFLLFSFIVNAQTTIYDIQYSATNGGSPLVGTIVTTTGTITAVEASGAFWIQEAEAAWSGIYVYDKLQSPVLGDNVTFSATVSEYNGLTELTSVSGYTVNSSGNTVNPISLTTVEVNDEKYEGVLVSVSNAQCTVLPDAFGTWTLNDGSGITKADDIIYNANPSVGVSYNLTGVVYERLTDYRVLPRSAADVVEISTGTETLITSFVLAEQTGVATINPLDSTITIEVANGTLLLSLTPTITVSSGATINPLSGVVQDFTNPVVYTVTAQDNVTTQDWTVTVVEQQVTPISDIQNGLKTGSVMVTGTITAVDATNYFWIQDAEAAWSGIYVYDKLQSPILGDNVTFSATVSEYNGLTELTSVSGYTINSSGNVVNPITVSTANANTEPYESVLVNVIAECTVANTASKWTINDGSGDLVVYGKIYDYTSPVVTTFYSVTGVMTWYNAGTTFQILPRSAADVNISLSANEVESKNINVYPNPIVNDLNIDNLSNITNIEISNVLGQSIMKFENDKSKTNIDFSKLNKGIYFVSLYSNNDLVETIKVSKK